MLKRTWQTPKLSLREKDNIPKVWVGAQLPCPWPWQTVLSSLCETDVIWSTLQHPYCCLGLNLMGQVCYPGISNPFLNPCPINPPLKWSLAAAQFPPVHFPVISDLWAQYWLMDSQINACQFISPGEILSIFCWTQQFWKWFVWNITIPYMWSNRIRLFYAYLKRL